MVQWDKFLGYRSDYGKGTRVRIPLVAKKKKKTFSVEVTIYQMGAGAVWVIPIAMVLDINALGGVQGSTL